MMKYILGALLLIGHAAAAQTYPFARLTGSPQMDTRGWRLTGDAGPGDTGGDADGLGNEMVLCNPTPQMRGACFFNQPVDISRCQQWTAEFDYRIYDGTGADGIAFCFLNQQPDAFTVGGNIGIPARPQGLMVIIDTYLNCTQLPSERVPKLLIRYADGKTTYGANTENNLECPAVSQPTSTRYDVLRQPVYNRMKITYDAGQVQVYVNNNLLLTGRYPISFPGYFGFTASTGGFTDRHSIRDFTLYTNKPIVSPPNAGADRTVCNGAEVELGTPPSPNDPYSYTWYPADGLSNPKAANPRVRLFNDVAESVTYTYFVTKDSAGVPDLCAYSDEVRITVQGKMAQAGPDLSLCPGEKGVIKALERDGYRYAWSPVEGLSDPQVARPTIRLDNYTDAPVTHTYILAVTPLTPAGCTMFDTLRVTVQPRGPDLSPAITLCPGDTVQLGAAPVTRRYYVWSPAAGLDDRTAANPALTLSNPTADPLTVTYVRSSWTTEYACQWSDTVRVTVLPKPLLAGPRSVCPNVPDVVYRVANPQPSVGYTWTVRGGTVRGGTEGDRITVDWGPAGTDASVTVTPRDGAGCPATVPITVNKVLQPQKPAGPPGSDTLCLTAGKNIAYETALTTGSVYTWGVSGNGVIVSGQGTHAVRVDWQGTGTGMLWVSERSVTRTDRCEGTSDTLRVWLRPAPGPGEVFIRSVSTGLDRDDNITVRFRVAPGANVSSPLTVSRRPLLPQAGNWEPVRSVSPRDSLLEDPGLATGGQVYEYRLMGTSDCNEPFASVSHHSILLTGTGDEAGETVQLGWNPYSGWAGGVKTYELWRKADEEKTFSLYGRSGPDEFTWAAANARDGFRQCYRVRAIEEGGDGAYSWSNEVCLTFEHPLLVPNVITPNGDGYNDRWVIRNLELYRQHRLRVVNRYGKTVLDTDAYGQNWDGRELAPGLYYYVLTTALNQQTIRGWVHMIR
ncbi:MAG: gliding motility-associated C-terminal domain-containing protein [Cytophagales bacterium]|nr:gliding motility-associated C-terminal domain-containing protein [Cytophagales bacterium]